METSQRSSWPFSAYMTSRSHRLVYQCGHRSGNPPLFSIFSLPSLVRSSNRDPDLTSFTVAVLTMMEAGESRALDFEARANERKGALLPCQRVVHPEGGECKSRSASKVSDMSWTEVHET